MACCAPRGDREGLETTRELEGIGAELLDGIRRRDDDVVLKYVASFGLSYGDIVVPKADEVRRRLRSR